MSGANGDDGLLAQALRDLLQAWHASGDQWRDQAREDFARLHLDAIERRVRDAARAVKSVERLLTEVERQCR